jgi:radical SAM protein with 4Fe4S-binding SPASM domain
LTEKSFPLDRIGWIDDFFSRIKDYLFFRDEDDLLILPPNRVVKLNGSGSALLKHLAGGRSIRRFPGLKPGRRALEVNTFFSNLKALYENTLTDLDSAHAVERRQFGFDFTTLPVLGELAVTYRCNNRCRFCYAGCGEAEKTVQTAGSGKSASAGPTPASHAGKLSAGRRLLQAEVAEPVREPSTTDPSLPPQAEVPPASAPALPPHPESRPSAELPLRKLKKIIRIFKEEAKIPFFSFTGGEPLLRGDLEVLIRYAEKLGLRTNLITNGRLATVERARSLFKAGMRTAQVSLESPDPEIHDALTGITGSWRQSVDGIAALQSAGISVQTNTTLTAENADTAVRLPEFLSRIRISRFSMNLYIPVTGSRENGPLFFPYSRTGEMLDRIRKEAQKYGLVFYWYSPLPHCQYNPIARGLGNKSCAAMDGLISVSPAGDVLPCSSYPEPMGNLLDRPFTDIWFSSRAAFFKQKQYAPPECSGCPAFTACQAACPLYWTFAGTKEIKNFAEVS